MNNELRAELERRAVEVARLEKLPRWARELVDGLTRTVSSLRREVKDLRQQLGGDAPTDKTEGAGIYCESSISVNGRALWVKLPKYARIRVVLAKGEGNRELALSVSLDEGAGWLDVASESCPSGALDIRPRASNSVRLCPQDRAGILGDRSDV